MKYELRKALPKHTLFFSCPCEKRAAHIRNEAVSSITKDDVSGVAFRYLQSREGQHRTRNEAAFYGVLGATIATLELIISPPSVVSSLSFFVHVPPNLGNTGRYRKTKRGCKEWLRNRLGEETFSRIQQLKYNENDVIELANILQEHGIDSSDLINRSREINHGCWI